MFDDDLVACKPRRTYFFGLSVCFIREAADWYTQVANAQRASSVPAKLSRESHCKVLFCRGYSDLGYKGS